MIKRIGIDLDNTVADYMSKAAPRLKEMFGIEPKTDAGISNPELAFLWGARDKQPKDKWEELGLSEQDRRILYGIRQTMYVEERFFRDMPMLETDTNQLTHELRKLGYKIYFITARTADPVIVEDTLFWLDSNGFVYEDAFFTPNKGALCKAMGISVMLEDDRSQIDECLDHGLHVVAKEWPWNKGIVRDNFHSASTWRAMLSTVREIR